MRKSDPTYFKPLAVILALIAGAGFYYASTTPGHHKIYLRSLCLLIAIGPAAILSVCRVRALWLARICIAAALMFYLVKSDRIDLVAMRSGLSQWPWLILGAVLVFLQAPIGALRWKWLLDVQDITLSYSQTLRLTLVSFFFNIFLPGATGGDLFKAYAITKKEKKTAEAVTTVILDRLTGMGGLLFLAAAALLLNIDFIGSNPAIRSLAWIMLVALVCGTVVICLLMSRNLAEFLRNSFLGRINFPGRPGLARAYRGLHAYHGSKSVLVKSVAISLLSHLFTVGAAACFAFALNLTGLTFFHYLLLIPLGLAFNAIPITPGGVGQGQAGFNYIFEHALPANASAGSLGGAMMTYIHCSMFLIGLVGAIIYAFGYHNLHEALEQAEEAEETVEDYFFKDDESTEIKEVAENAEDYLMPEQSP